MGLATAARSRSSPGSPPLPACGFCSTCPPNVAGPSHSFGERRQTWRLSLGNLLHRPPLPRGPDHLLDPQDAAPSRRADAASRARLLVLVESATTCWPVIELPVPRGPLLVWESGCLVARFQN